MHPTGKGVCMAGGMCGWGHAWQGCAWQGDMHGKGGMHGGESVVQGVHGRECVAGMHGSWHAWQGGHMWQERWPLQRTVRILLECILLLHRSALTEQLHPFRRCNPHISSKRDFVSDLPAGGLDLVFSFGQGGASCTQCKSKFNTKSQSVIILAWGLMVFPLNELINQPFHKMNHFTNIKPDTPINVYTRFCLNTAKSKFSLVSPVADW